MEIAASNVPDKRALVPLGALVGNIGFLILYFAYDLSLYQLVVIYWLECLWIGFFGALKLIAASILGDPYENRIANFSVGANLFATLIALFYLGGAFLSFAGGLGLAVIFIPAELAGVAAMDLLKEGARAIIIGSMLLTIGHGLSFVINFLILGEVKTARVRKLIAWPFKRCLILLGSIVIALGTGLVAPQLAGTTAFAAILIGIKVLADLRSAFNASRHRDRGDP